MKLMGKIDKEFPGIGTTADTCMAGNTSIPPDLTKGGTITGALEISSSSITDYLKLTTTSSDANPVKLIFEKTGSEQGIIEYNRNGDLEIYNTDGDGGVMISGSASADPDIYANHAGNVGIGTATPSEALTVSGDISRDDGDLNIINKHTNGDIVFKTDAGTYPASQKAYLSIKGQEEFIHIPDDIKLVFGDRTNLGSLEGDLYIGHISSNSYIVDQGAGDLNIRATNLALQSSAGENFLYGSANGSVEILYDGTKKFETTSAGIDVTGNIGVSGTVDGRDIASDGTKLDGIQTGAHKSPNRYGSIIKLIPSDFVTNDDGGATKFGIGYKDDTGTTYGMKPSASTVELYTFVCIPEGMKATHVDVYAKQNRDIEVFEIQINANTMVSKGTGTSNTQLTLTSEVESSATNVLAIKIDTTSTADRIFGGAVTIATI